MAGMLSARLAPTALQGISVATQRIILIGAVVLFVITRPFIASSSGWTVLFESVSGAIVVGVLAQGQTGRFLDLGPLRFVGRISYSFYLLHPIAWHLIIVNITTLSLIPGPDIVVSMTCWALSVAFTTPLAWASYRFVEVPMMALGKSIWTHSRNGVTVSNK